MNNSVSVCLTGKHAMLCYLLKMYYYKHCMTQYAYICICLLTITVLECTAASCISN